MTLTIDIKESATDKILYFLEHFKDDVTILDQDEEYLRLLEEAKRDRKGIKSIDELLKEYSIGSFTRC